MPDAGGPGDALIEACSRGPYLEVFARGRTTWLGFLWKRDRELQTLLATYANHSQSEAAP